MPYSDVAKARAASRDWYLANREKAMAADLARHRAAQRANPVLFAAGRAAVRANIAAKSLGLAGRITAEDVLKVWAAQPTCVACGSGRGIDHVVAMSDGGANEPANLQTMCGPCNGAKGSARTSQPRSSCQRGHPFPESAGIKRLTGKRFCVVCNRERSRERGRAQATTQQEGSAPR